MRLELNSQKLRQAAGASHSAGRFTRPQLTTNVDSAIMKSDFRRARTHSSSSGPSRNSG